MRLVLLMFAVIRSQSAFAWILPSLSRHAARSPPFVTTTTTRILTASDDFFHQPHFEPATTTTILTKEQQQAIPKMVDCAKTGECTLEEMDHMIAELESLRHDEAQDKLKHALELQRELAVLKDDLTFSTSPPGHYLGDIEDHSFQHYVDYRDLGDYESH